MGAEVIHERGGEGRSGKGFREADQDLEGGLRGTGLSSVPPRVYYFISGKEPLISAACGSVGKSRLAGKQKVASSSVELP
jgi:hypothetical protein